MQENETKKNSQHHFNIYKLQQQRRTFEKRSVFECVMKMARNYVLAKLSIEFLFSHCKDDWGRKAGDAASFVYRLHSNAEIVRFNFFFFFRCVAFVLQSPDVIWSTAHACSILKVLVFLCPLVHLYQLDC